METNPTTNYIPLDLAIERFGSRYLLPSRKESLRDLLDRAGVPKRRGGHRVFYQEASIEAALAGRALYHEMRPPGAKPSLRSTTGVSND